MRQTLRCRDDNSACHRSERSSRASSDGDFRLPLERVDVVRRVGAFRLELLLRDDVRFGVVERVVVLRWVVDLRVVVLREVVDLRLEVLLRAVVFDVVRWRAVRPDVDRPVVRRPAPLSGPRISVHVRSTMAATESANPTLRPLDERAVPISSAKSTR